MNPKLLFTLLAGIGPFITLFKVKTLLDKLSEKTRCIAILGMKGAGKTTLWNALRGKLNVEYEPTFEEEIKEFKIQVENREVGIATTKDIGGDYQFVKGYGELIKDGTFIYFLIDINELNIKGKELEEKRLNVRSRLDKILKLVTGENGKKNCGIMIFATHKDVFLDNIGRQLCDADLTQFVIKKLNLSQEPIGNSSNGSKWKIKPIDLTDDSSIQNIKMEIVNS